MDYLLLVLGGPNKYYDYDDQNLRKIFDKIKKISSSDNLQTIVIIIILKVILKI